MNAVTRYTRRRSLLKSIKKLQAICPDIPIDCEKLRAVAYERYPTVRQSVTLRMAFHINFIRAMRVLWVPAVRAVFIWKRPSWYFIRSMYPLEWARAIAILPELNEVADDGR